MPVYKNLLAQTIPELPIKNADGTVRFISVTGKGTFECKQDEVTEIIKNLVASGRLREIRRGKN